MNELNTVSEMKISENPYQRLGMSLSIVKGWQDMSLNAHKLLRLAVMQNRFTKGGELSEYRITTGELIRILDVDKSRIYKEADSITTEIMQQVIKMGDPNHSEKSWTKFNWVNICKYDHIKQEIRIKLHDQLKPFLLDLSRDYLQYEYSEMLYMGSVYGLRLYELIRGKSGYERKSPVNEHSFKVELSVAEVRMACGLGNKYKQIGEFKKSVIETGIKHINANSNWMIVGYENGKKDGKFVKTLLFEVTLNTPFITSVEGIKRYTQYRDWKISQGFTDYPKESIEILEGQTSFGID